MPQTSARRLRLNLTLHQVKTSHGYILKAHMNEHTLLDDNVMKSKRMQDTGIQLSSGNGMNIGRRVGHQFRVEGQLKKQLVFA
jgi:hypothetical protein